MPKKALGDIEGAQGARERTWRPSMMDGTMAGSYMPLSASGMRRGFASRFRLVKIADPDVAIPTALEADSPPFCLVTVESGDFDLVRRSTRTKTVYAVRTTQQDIDGAIGDLMILVTRHIRDAAKRGDLQRRLDAFTHEIMEAIAT
jgi:hypothetical protein